MKTYRVYAWHGPSESLTESLLSVGCTLTEDGIMKYEGTLDEFAEKWSRHFMVHTDGCGRWVICVTQYNSFGAR